MIVILETKGKDGIDLVLGRRLDHALARVALGRETGDGVGILCLGGEGSAIDQPDRGRLCRCGGLIP